MGRPRHAGAGAVAVAAGSTIATISTFGPWATSGARARSSYGLVDVAERAGVVPAWVAPYTWTWFLVPVLCGAVLVAVALRRVRLAAIAAATLGTLVTTGGVLVARSPLVIEPAAIIGAATGGVTVVTGVAVHVTALTTGRGR